MAETKIQQLCENKLASCSEIADFLKSQHQYGNNHLMAALWLKYALMV